MIWWQSLCLGLLEFGVAVFFVVYIIRRGSLEANIDIKQIKEQMKQGFQPQILTKLQQAGGCLKMLDLPLAPGLLFTAIFAYIMIAMFLSIPLHPVPDYRFWQFITSGVMVTFLLSPPMIILAVMQTVMATRFQKIDTRIYFVQILSRALFNLIILEIVVWFGIHA